MIHSRKRYSAPSVLAMLFCWSASELSDYRYQSTRTNGAVYSIGEHYYCCVPLGKLPYQDRASVTKWNWLRVDSAFAHTEGFQIWKAVA